VPGSHLQLSAPERAVLVAPDRVARAAASVLLDAEQRWLLRQPRPVRRSFALEVLSRGDGDPIAQERWMLLQSDDVRRSYVAEVLDPRVQARRPDVPGPPWPLVAAGAAGAAAAIAGVVYLITS
jgi:hypothetical protein